jgi:hypothetical protein
MGKSGAINGRGSALELQFVHLNNWEERISRTQEQRHVDRDEF